MSRQGGAVVEIAVGACIDDLPSPADGHGRDGADQGVAAARGIDCAGVLDGNCRVSDQPAATLLIPYFEVDLDNASGATTLISVNNASSKSALARVVLWTNWGIPTLAFDVYLTGFDVQTLNIRDLFGGELPATGLARSPNGELSEPSQSFPGCEQQARELIGTAGGKTGVVLANAKSTYLRAAHTGQPVNVGPAASQCVSGGGAAPGLATGYITVDVVNRCSPSTVATIQNTPAHAMYFGPAGTGLASNDNVLWGDVTYVDPAKSAALSVAAVHVVADAEFFTPGSYSFYGRYVGYDGRDGRAPLASLYYSRYVNGGSFGGGTDLLVWRDNRVADVSPRTCGTTPSWSPLGEMQLIAFDEEENPTAIPNSNAFPLATQKVHVGSPAIPAQPAYGWLMMDLWHADATHAQASVTVMMSSGGRYSGGYPAVRADDLCNFGL